MIPQDNVLETAIVRVTGDDTELAASLRRMVDNAQAAADKMGDLLSNAGGMKGVSDAFKQATTAAQEYARATKQSREEDDVSLRMARDFQQRIKDLNKEYAAGLVPIDDYRARAVELQKRMEALTGSTDEGTRAWSTLIAGLATANKSINQLDIRRLRSDVMSFRDETEKAGGAAEGTADGLRDLIKRSDELAASFDRGTQEYRQATLYGGTAARMLATLSGETTTFGLSANVAVAIQKSFNDELREGGPLAQAYGAQLDRLGISATSAGDAAEQLGFSIATKLNASALGFVGTLTTAMRTQADWAGELVNTSARVRTSVEDLQELQFAAEVTGVGFDNVAKALESLTRRAGQSLKSLGDARGESGELITGVGETYRELGVQILDVDGKLRDGIDILADTADAFQKLRDQNQQVALAQELFGRAGTKLLPILQDGSAGIDRLRERARELGTVLTGESVDALVSYGTMMAEVTTVMETARRQIMAELAPALQETLLPLFREAVIPTVQTFVRTFSSLLSLLHGSDGTITTFGRTFSTVGTSVGIATSAIIALRVAVMALGVTLNTVAPVLRIINLAILGVSAAMGVAAGLRGGGDGTEDLTNAAHASRAAIQGLADTAAGAIPALDSLRNATSEAQLRGSVQALASTLTGEGRDAFLAYAEQAIATGEDVGQVAADIRRYLLQMQLDAAENALSTATQELNLANAELNRAVDRNARNARMMNDAMEAYTDLVVLREEAEAELAAVLAEQAASSAPEEYANRVLLLTASVNEYKAAVDTASAAASRYNTDLLDGVSPYQRLQGEAYEHVYAVQAEIAALQEAIETGGDYITTLKGATRATSDLGGAGDDAADGINNLGGAVKNFAAGSIADLEQRIQRINTELRELGDPTRSPELVAAMKTQRDDLETQLAALRALLDDDNIATAAKEWSDRLALEFEFGMKDTADIVNLVGPRVLELRDNVRAALRDSGQDSADFVKNMMLLEPLEELLRSIGVTAKE